MLYTKGHGATPGHFEDLIPKQAHATHKATGSRMSGFAVHVPVFVGGMESETPSPRPRQRFKLADFQPVIDVEALSVESDLQAAQAEPPLPPVAAMPSSWSGSAQPLSNWEAHATLPQPWLQHLRKRGPTSTDPRADAAPMQVPPLRPTVAVMPPSWGWQDHSPHHEPRHERDTALEPQQQQPPLQLQLQLPIQLHLPLPLQLHYHYFTTLHCTALHYTTLHYTTAHYTTSHYTTLQHTTLQYTTRHYATLHYTTLHYTTRHYITVHLHYITLRYMNYITLQYMTTLHYSTLRHTTLHLQLQLHYTTSHQLTSPIVCYSWNFRHRLTRYYWYQVWVGWPWRFGDKILAVGKLRLGDT